MKFLSLVAPLLTVLASSLLACHSVVDAHGWLLEPKSRETASFTDLEGKAGCPSNTPGQSTSVQPGEKLKVRWQRNNHVGGFIRWAIVARGQEGKEAFDKNVFFYTCRESGGCLPPGQNSRYMGDNGAPANSVMCGDTITLPDYLPAGDYVLQWTWMSAGASYGNLEWTNEQYRSCADLKFTTAGTGKRAACPTFVGGDRVTKLENKGDDVCFYFRDNGFVTSIFKGEKGKADEYYKFGKPAEIETCKGDAAVPATGKVPVAGEGGAGAGAGAGATTKPDDCDKEIPFAGEGEEIPCDNEIPFAGEGEEIPCDDEIPFAGEEVPCDKEIPFADGGEEYKEETYGGEADNGIGFDALQRGTTYSPGKTEAMPTH